MCPVIAAEWRPVESSQIKRSTQWAGSLFVNGRPSSHLLLPFQPICHPAAVEPPAQLLHCTWHVEFIWKISFFNFPALQGASVCFPLSPGQGAPRWLWMKFYCPNANNSRHLLSKCPHWMTSHAIVFTTKTLSGLGRLLMAAEQVAIFPTGAPLQLQNDTNNTTRRIVNPPRSLTSQLKWTKRATWIMSAATNPHVRRAAAWFIISMERTNGGHYSAEFFCRIGRHRKVGSSFVSHSGGKMVGTIRRKNPPNSLCVKMIRYYSAESYFFDRFARWENGRY